MVTRTPGPFPYFGDEHGGVTGDSIRADTEDPALNAKTLGSLADELDGDASRVPAQMSGDITAVTQQNPQRVATGSRALAAKGWFAIGLVRQWADCVDVFDTTVNQINLDYNSQVAQGGTTPPDVKASLRPRYSSAEDLLESGADMVATGFQHPDDPDTLKNLFAGGSIPLEALVLFPQVTLSTNELANAILSGHYPPDIKRLMTLAAAARMDPQTTLRYYQRLTLLTPAQRAALLPENFLDRGLEQPDSTTCGSSTLVMSQMLTHPDYAMRILLGYDPATGDSYDAPDGESDPAAWRFAQDSLAMHDRTNDGFLFFDWPKSLGTLPGDLTDQMNDGSGPPGTDYFYAPITTAITGTEPDPSRVFDVIGGDANQGKPVPLYVGDDLIPRHVVLVTGQDGDELTVYDPSKGHTMTVTRDQWVNQEGDLGGNWGRRWFAVLPDGSENDANPQPTPSPSPGASPTPPGSSGPSPAPTAPSSPSPLPTPTPTP